MSAARKTLTVTLDLEGAALASPWGDEEAAGLLLKAARQVDRLRRGRDGGKWAVGSTMNLLDTNGVTVGTMTVTKQ